MRRLPLLLAALLPLAAAAATAETRPVPGTRVRLEVPEGFRLEPALPGIGREADLTSVVVTELPLPRPRAEADFSAEALAERGIELLRKGEVRVDGRRATLLHGIQRAGGITFRKWLLLLGDATGSVLLTATTPLDLESRHGEALVRVLRSASWDPARPRARGPGLRFRVREVPPFEIVTTAENAVVLGNPGHEGPGVPPLVVAGSSLGQVHVGDLPAFARERLRQSPTLDDVEILAEREARLAERPAWEIEARARDSASGRAVRVRQRLASEGGRYLLVQGIVDAADDVAVFAERFDGIAESFALEPQDG